jgi:ribosomal protein S18 acetylase RimI-like enzyme
MSAILTEPLRNPANSARSTTVVRSLRESDLTRAERMFRLAFGTFLRAPQPETFWADRDYVRARWLTDPASAFGVYRDGDLLGTNFAVSWGSVGFFGPLTIDPQCWDQGLGAQLVNVVVERLDQSGVRHAGLFTFAESGKHIGLYQKFGFCPRFLTAVMSAPVEPVNEVPQAFRFSMLAKHEEDQCLADCLELTNKIYDGLDLCTEIREVRAQQRGDTVLLRDDSRLSGLAVCHYGPRSEAGAGACLIKFATIRPGPAAQQSFDRLLVACKRLAMEAGMSRLLAGVNTECSTSYRHLLARNFRTEMQGVNMHRPNNPGYYRPEIYLLDDWR